MRVCDLELSTGHELTDKYKVAIVGYPLHKPCHVMCQCGHHIKFHHGQGSDGYCELCSPTRHSITTGNIPPSLGQLNSYFGFCHNFYPVGRSI